MTAFPQYAKTSHPAVIETLRRNKELDKGFLARGTAFAEAHGGTAFYSSRWGNTASIVAIKADEKPTSGRWKQHPRGGWLPYKNNPIYKEFEAITLKLESIPGLPEHVESAYNERMQHYIASPKPYEVDGAVYVGFSFVPQDHNRRHDPDPRDGGWEEIKASEWHAAAEAFNARVGATA